MSDWLFVSKFTRIQNQHVPLGLCLLVNISQYCEPNDKTQKRLYGLVRLCQYIENVNLKSLPEDET